MEETTSGAAVRTEAETEEMLDRMLTRLALCDDSKLEALLEKLLPIAVSSLSSPSSAVRNKVVEILSHVNKRVKLHPEIGLPLAELWELFQRESASPMVRNFSIMYIEMAFERADLKVLEGMAPSLLINISNLTPQHQETILRLVSKVIGECHSTKVDETVATQYRLLNNPNDRELFVEFCLHSLLYHSTLQGGCSPGLSILQSSRVAGKTVLKREVLLIRKLGILNVVDMMELSPELAYPLYLVASADCQEAVLKRGEELIKKKAASVNLDDANLINRLFFLFNGTTVENVVPESRVIPGSTSLKIKLMSTFCRSIKAANSFPATLQCIFGCIYGNGTTSRLKQFGMEFTVWVFKHAGLDQLKLMGPIILSGIVKLLDSYNISETEPVARDIKSFCFQAIGLLSQRLPHLFRDKTDMAVRLFDSLQVESRSLCLVIQETTNSLATAYKGASNAVLSDLEKLLLKHAQAEQNEVRFCAVRWAITLFNFQHCPSRYICMLGAADPRLDIREMALEGLFPVNNNDHPTTDNIEYPTVSEMIDYIFCLYPELMSDEKLKEQKLLFPSQTYVVMIKFLLKCFESEFEHNASVRISSDFLCSAEKMCSLIEQAMTYDASVELYATASRTIITIATYLPEMIASHYASRISWIMQLLSHIDLDTRESAARLLGIACSAVPATSSSHTIRELLSQISKKDTSRFETTHGALCAIGYVTADYASKTNAISDELLQNVLQCLIDVVSTETAVLASVAMQTLGYIGLRIPLPPLVNHSREGHVLPILKKDITKFLIGEDYKAIKKIIISLGHICVLEESSSYLSIALDLIFSLCRTKVEDVLFTAGEALSFLWGGVSVTADIILKTNYTSLSKSSNILLVEPNMALPKNHSVGLLGADDKYHLIVRDTVTSKLFDSLLYSSRKEERCAGAVWLLSLTMHCGRHPSITKMIPEIQEAFSHLLGDQSELTQELASQGMSIVYELGDPLTKKNLVDALVSVLTGSVKRKRAIKLTEDSEVFQVGAIGESPSGGKLSTYKELCSLANEMGQPDLIYKFMDLANHQALLNSKRGAAFGFSKIAKQAGDALQPHLQSLIPRLFRYQYDPDKNVQDAMANIWKSLVTEPKKIVDEYFDLIIDDLISQCGSRLWRSREASCLALSDVIQGRRFDQIGKHLKKLWTASFRSMDDIKETVRNAGERLCRAVSLLTLRMCDISLTEISNAKKSMDAVLPLLLSEGVLSKVDSIRKASVATVVKIAKEAGTALRPHLPDLVCCMLESLSSLEDQRLNYVELHAENIGIQSEKLENLRVSISKGSAMWETLDLSIDAIDSESLNILVPRLGKLVRSGVGLNTRVGVATFICLLIQKVGVDIKPFTSLLLKVLFLAVKEERSSVAKRAFASACARVLKYATPVLAQKFIEDTAAMHAGDVNEQITCVILLKSYASIAADLMAGYQAVVIPIIYISRFQDDKNVSNLYEELWEENISGERISMQLYMGEIVCLICEGISCSSWASKRKSALAICKLGEVLGESLSPCHKVLLDAILKELPGRLWEGKDSLLDAIGALCSSCHKAIYSENPDLPSTILNMVISACKKKVKKYRETAYITLDKVIRAFGNPEFFETVFPMLLEICELKAMNNSPSSIADDTSKEGKEADADSLPREKIVTCLTSCIHVANLNDILNQKSNLIQMLVTFLSDGFQWTVKMAVFSSIKELCFKLGRPMKEAEATSSPNIVPFVQELYQSTSPKILACLKTVKIAQVHIAASECLLHVIGLHKPLEMNVADPDTLMEQLHSLCDIEKNEEAKMLLKKGISLVEDLHKATS